MDTVQFLFVNYPFININDIKDYLSDGVSKHT